MRIGIVADDVTGAADAAAPTVACRFSARVAFWKSPCAIDGTEELFTVALSTETRDLAGSEAHDIASRVRAAFETLSKEYRVELLFKKIDSRLRGHVEAETRAAVDAAQGRIALIC